MTSAERASLCILSRGPNVRLDPLEPHDIRARLAEQLAAGFDCYPDRYSLVADALTRRGGWLLTLSTNPYDALPFIRTMLEERAE